MEETDETFYMVAILSLFFFLLMLGGFIWITRSYSRKIWLPFYETLKTLRSFDLKNNKSINLAEARIDEFKELNNSIAELTQNSVDAYRSQKEFTENASHELQTPVAVLKSKIDLLLQDPSLTSEQADAISHLLQPLSRLSHINRNLLLFAKIENYSYVDEEDIDINGLLVVLIDQIREYTAIEIEFYSTKDLRVRANRTLVEIMLNNLLVNAVRYGNNKKVSADLRDNRLIISNTGETSLDTGKLFKRYINASPDSPGSGLGLAIVAEICEKNLWTYAYEFKDREHKFSIVF
jgi:signal transduction histidine kinase